VAVIEPTLVSRNFRRSVLRPSIARRRWIIWKRRWVDRRCLQAVQLLLVQLSGDVAARPARPRRITTPALAGAGAMDQEPMLRAAAARAAIQRRECSEILLTLSMFAFELKSCGRHEPFRSKYAGSSPPATPDPLNDAGREGVAECSVGRGRGPNPVVRRRRSRRGGSVLDHDQSGDPAGCGNSLGRHSSARRW
jgi:hypothetical protein